MKWSIPHNNSWWEKVEFKIWNCTSGNLKHWWTSWWRTRFYRIYMWIRWRCYTMSDNSYDDYWWNWIICEWNTFEKFKKDMYESYLEHCEKYWERNTTIDRYPNMCWNYCKKNCRWATYKEQANNRRPYGSLKIKDKKIIWDIWLNNYNKSPNKKV